MAVWNRNCVEWVLLEYACALGEAYDTAKFVTAATAWLDYARDLLG